MFGAPKKNGFGSVTEYPGAPASKGQLDKLYQRYTFVRRFIDKGDVLELGCGTGLGLEYLSERAGIVVGGDIDWDNLCCALEQCDKSAYSHICQLDAHHLPFQSGSFDTVLFLEGLYYLQDPKLFFAESHRVLRPGGCLILCTVNCDVPAFHTSPFARHYYSVPELHRMASEVFPTVEMYGAFEIQRNWWFLFLKRAAVRLGLMPRSLEKRSKIKRLFGPLLPIPERVHEGMAQYDPPQPLSAGAPDEKYQIVYCVARVA